MEKLLSKAPEFTTVLVVMVFGFIFYNATTTLFTTDDLTRKYLSFISALLSFGLMFTWFFVYVVKTFSK